MRILITAPSRAREEANIIFIIIPLPAGAVCFYVCAHYTD